MKLTKVHVRNYRNILDSTPVAIEPEVTCLVGKNESGKTAFLQALHRLNPSQENVAFSVPEQYPAWLEKRHRMRGDDLEAFIPVSAVLELDESDCSALEQPFGPGTVKSKTITFSRSYKGKPFLAEIQTDERLAVQHVITESDLPHGLVGEARKAKSFDELRSHVDGLNSTENDEDKAAAASLQKAAGTMLEGNKAFKREVNKIIYALTPHFFYFSEYSNLRGTVAIRELLEADKTSLDADELTARSLLEMAGTENDYMLNPDYERRKRELENVANALTHDVLTYWTTNPELRVVIDITQETVTDDTGSHTVLDELKLRMWDDRHWLSLPFDERSSGFRWFFSFLAAFSEYERAAEPIILLLDEPGLGLHARAQKDFLRFIDERLAPKCQVIHTTHSPFMVQPGKLERVRLVEDRGRDIGARVSQDVLASDPDTLFPLQGALGYDLVQHLFIAPNNVVVEGTSDYTYLSVISDFLRDQGRVCLDDRWSIVPVGGADMIPTFVALLGIHLEITVLVDARKSGHQRLTKLAKDGYLAETRIITIGEVIGKRPADIEDVFAIDDYLLLYNRAFVTDVKADDIEGSDPIVSRIARHLGVDRFDHGRPADILLRHRDELLPKLGSETLTHFERLFQRINDTMAA